MSSGGIEGKTNHPRVCAHIIKPLDFRLHTYPLFSDVMFTGDRMRHEIQARSIERESKHCDN